MVWETDHMLGIKGRSSYKSSKGYQSLGHPSLHPARIVSEWMAGTVNFTLLDAKSVCIPKNIPRLMYVTQLSTNCLIPFKSLF